MLPKEIVDILIKYQKDLEHSVFEINYSINEINNATHNIFASLKQVQMSLGYYLNNSVTKNIVHDNENEILNDLKTLRTYINSIESFRICKTQQEQEKLSEYIPRTSHTIYIIQDNICPYCNEKLFPHTIKYQRKKDNILYEESVDWYICKMCHKKFAIANEIKDFYSYNTDISFNKKYYNKTYHCDAIVIFNINKCSKHNHKIEDLVCDLPIIDKEGNLKYQTVDIIHCKTCNRFIMLKSIYDNLHGTPVNPIIDDTYGASNLTENDFYYGDKGGSKLRQYGYNVNCNDKLTVEQRQKILLVHLLAKDITQGEIYSILDTNINRGIHRIDSKRDWSNAVEKWKMDKLYVQQLDLETESKKINIDKIILKFRRKNKNGTGE